jgi:outer membrane beta-barrel protein
MENWHKRFLLTAVATVGSLIAGVVSAQSTTVGEEVISPDIDRRAIEKPAIDTEDFEIGVYVGILSIEDFNSEIVYGVRGAWHITEDFFFEVDYAVSEADLTSYEELTGGPPLFEDSERDYSYYTLNLGWNVLPGEVYVLDKYTMKSDFFLIAGAGSTDFLGDNWFTVSVGAGYRLLLNDSITWRVDVRDHIFDRDVFGFDSTTNNIEWSTGVTFFF